MTQVLNIDFGEFDIKTLYQLKSKYTLDYYQKIFDFIELYFDESISSFDCYTSGSTSHPKKITISKSAAKYSSSITIDYFQLTNTSTLLLSLDIDKIAGKMQLIRAIESKATIYITELANNILTFNELKHLDVKFDFATFSPNQLFKIFNKYPSSYFEFFSKILIGGVGINRFFLKNLLTFSSNVNFYESFGMTETISHFAIKNISKGDDFFQVLGDYTISLDEHSRLIVHNPNVSDTPILTNDIINIIDNNKFKFQSRYDNMINSGGIKIYPELIEAMLDLDFPFFITSRKDSKFTNLVILVAMTDPSHFNEINNCIDNNIDNKVLRPKEVFFLDEFVYTNNKINRNETVKLLNLSDIKY